ncbi:MAG TPA: DUF4230 domain-containing protein [Kiritimatiellia bacterium]|nr:DUF4230 domain-containing protein [Kiritimatiellia bacterium]
MTDWLIALLVGAGIGAFAVWRGRGKRPAPAAQVTVHSSIEELRTIGELSVFKALTKEIVTARDHWAGSFGQRYLEWLFTSKKMAMIFAFDIDFRFDLRDPAFRIIKSDGGVRLELPPLRYDIHIRDITFYDEQKTKMMPWLLPDLINAAFGSGFNEQDRNKLKDEARAQAEKLAANLVHRLKPEVHSSARETLLLLARGFTDQPVEIVFEDKVPQQASVEFAAEPRR